MTESLPKPSSKPSELPNPSAELAIKQTIEMKLAFNSENQDNQEYASQENESFRSMAVRIMGYFNLIKNSESLDEEEEKELIKNCDFGLTVSPEMEIKLGINGFPVRMIMRIPEAKTAISAVRSFEFGWISVQSREISFTFHQDFGPEKRGGLGPEAKKFVIKKLRELIRQYKNSFPNLTLVPITTSSKNPILIGKIGI